MKLGAVFLSVNRKSTFGVDAVSCAGAKGSRMKKRLVGGFIASSDQYRVDGLAKAFLILEEIAQGENASVDTLAQQTRLSAGVVKRILIALEQHELTYTQNGRYGLGMGWLRLAQVREAGLDLRRFATPVMQHLRDRLEETVILAVRSGSRRVNIDYVESKQPVRRITQPGFEVALHIGATGRVLMSDFTDKAFDGYLQNLEGSALTAVGLTPARLRKECRRAHLSGHAVARREITTDTAAVSAPIYGMSGQIVAALTVTFPEYRFTEDAERICIGVLIEATRTVSLQLGYDVSLLELSEECVPPSGQA
ncbi:MAG: IclR family transcriptional regulator [Hyphomicrobiales bacterium]|nr:IclR family transcriptional regulator [Hyphomicrobiales bacterium]